MNNVIDIKSKKIKVLLVKAGLYFDKNGKLTKRVEAITNVDIDGDGKADTQEIKPDPDETLFEQVRRSNDELKTIINIDLSEIDKDGNMISTKKEEKEEPEVTEEEFKKEVKVNIFIIVWRKIVKFFKKVFKNIKLVNQLGQPDKEKVTAAVLESADEVVKKDYNSIMNSTVDQIVEVKEVATEKASADVKPASNTETKVVEKEKPVTPSTNASPQDALSAILGHK